MPFIMLTTITGPELFNLARVQSFRAFEGGGDTGPARSIVTFDDSTAGYRLVNETMEEIEAMLVVARPATRSRT